MWRNAGYGYEPPIIENFYLKLSSHSRPPTVARVAVMAVSRLTETVFVPGTRAFNRGRNRQATSHPVPNRSKCRIATNLMRKNVFVALKDSRPCCLHSTRTLNHLVKMEVGVWGSKPTFWGMSRQSGRWRQHDYAPDKASAKNPACSLHRLHRARVHHPEWTVLHSLESEEMPTKQPPDLAATIVKQTQVCAIRLCPLLLIPGKRKITPLPRK